MGDEEMAGVLLNPALAVSICCLGTVGRGTARVFCCHTRARVRTWLRFAACACVLCKALGSLGSFRLCNGLSAHVLDSLGKSRRCQLRGRHMLQPVSWESVAGSAK
jgi:hypothetical protein